MLQTRYFVRPGTLLPHNFFWACRMAGRQGLHPFTMAECCCRRCLCGPVPLQLNHLLIRRVWTSISDRDGSLGLRSEIQLVGAGLLQPTSPACNGLWVGQATRRFQSRLRALRPDQAHLACCTCLDCWQSSEQPCIYSRSAAAPQCSGSALSSCCCMRSETALAWRPATCAPCSGIS